VFFYDYLKSLAPIPERVSIIAVLKDEPELIDQLGHPGL